MTAGKLTVGADGKLRGPAKITYNTPFPCVNGEYNAGGPGKRGVLMHTMVCDLPECVRIFNRKTDPPRQASAQFGIAQDGTIWQFGPIGKNWDAWHAGGGNGEWYGIEFADHGKPDNPITAAQATAGAQVVECLSGYADFPLAVTDSPAGTGFGTHVMGGVAWSPTRHTCPDSSFPGQAGPHTRSRQRAAIIAEAKQIRGGGGGGAVSGPVEIEGIDYSFGSGLTAAQIKGAGKHFVCRYLAPAGLGKVIKKAEFDSLVGGGVKVVLVWEWDGHDCARGRSGGASDAHEADQQVTALGAAGVPVYFAPVDFDAGTNLAIADDYLDGAASVLGLPRMGGYGDYRRVQHWLNAGKVTYAWQTYAWSGGDLDGRAHLYQYRNAQRLGPAEVDYTKALKADYGQWPRPLAAPPPPALEDEEMPSRALPTVVGGTETLSWTTGTARGYRIVTDTDGDVEFAIQEYHTDPSPRWVDKGKVATKDGAWIRVNFAGPDDCTALMVTLTKGQGTSSVHTIPA